jgi:hypothetical protein
MRICAWFLAISCLAAPAGADPTSPLMLIRPDDALGPPHDPRVRGTELGPDAVVEEFLVEGVASVYNYPDDPPVRGEIAPIGHLTNAPYRTRLMVRRPADPADFNGTVVIEWWNSTAGFDVAPVWDASHGYFARKGIAYVGWTNSNQSLGFLVDGCRPLPSFNPTCGTRYETLFLGDNGQAYEIGSQIANALKNGPNSPLPEGFAVERVFHAGQSQQGGSMVTYASAFHLDGVNDGYFVQAAGSARAIKDGIACGDPEAEPFPDCPRRLEGEDRRVRSDLPVPVYRSQTETDVFFGLMSGDPGQEDTETFRYYEMPGTAHVTTHADVHPFGLPFLLEDLCELPLNSLADGPVFGSFLYNAMWENMERQVADGAAPPQADRIEREGGEIARDEFDNALGGLRLPELDVPVASYGPSNLARPFGEPVGGLANLFCRLAGTVTPLDAGQLEALYPTPQEFLTPYEARADALVEARFLLPEDAETLKAMAVPEPGVAALRLAAAAVLALAARRRRRIDVPPGSVRAFGGGVENLPEARLVLPTPDTSPGRAAGAEGKRLVAAHEVSGRIAPALRIDAEVGAAREQLLDGDARLEPGRGSPDAEVRPVAEAEDAPDPARHVAFLRIGAELALVAIGRSVEEHDLATLGNRRALDVDVARRGSGQALYG